MAGEAGNKASNITGGGSSDSLRLFELERVVYGNNLTRSPGLIERMEIMENTIEKITALRSTLNGFMVGIGINLIATITLILTLISKLAEVAK